MGLIPTGRAAYHSGWRTKAGFVPKVAGRPANPIQGRSRPPRGTPRRASAMVLDLIFGILLAIGAYRGLRRGFAHQMVRWTALIAAFVFAYPLAQRLGPWLGERLSLPAGLVPSIALLSCLVALYGGVTIAGSIYLHFLRRKNPDERSGADSVLGVPLGLARSALFVSVVILLLKMLPPFLKDATPLAKQMESSKVVALDDEYPIARWLLEFSEVQRVGGAVSDLFRTVRNDGEDDPADAPPAPATAQP